MNLRCIQVHNHQLIDNRIDTSMSTHTKNNESAEMNWIQSIHFISLRGNCIFWMVLLFVSVHIADAVMLICSEFHQYIEQIFFYFYGFPLSPMHWIKFYCSWRKHERRNNNKIGRFNPKKTRINCPLTA